MNFIISLIDKITLSKKKKFQNIEKIIAFSTIFLFVISTLILVIISFYGYMCADDYSYGIGIHDIWSNPSNKNILGLWKIVKIAASNVQHNYLNWGGNYTASFFNCFHPGNFNLSLIPLSTIILLSSFILSGMFFWKTLLIDYFNFKSSSFIIITCCILLFTMQFVYSGVEAYFWFLGGFYTLVGFSGMLLLFTMLYRSIYIKVATNVQIIFMILLAIWCAGTSYISILTTLLILFLLGIDIIRDKKLLKKQKYTYFFILSLFTIFALVNILAPGNGVRQSNFNTPDSAILVIMKALLQGRNLIHEYLDYKLLLICLFITPFIWKNTNTEKRNFKYPLLIILCGYFLFSASLTPNLYALGALGAARSRNVYWWTFCYIFFTTYIYLIGWIKANIEYKLQVFITKKPACLLGIYLSIFCLLFFFSNIEYLNTAVSYQAFKSLVVGDAQKFKQENDERIKLYNNPDIKDVEVKPYSVYPAPIYLNDLSEDPNDWQNVDMAEYFKKNSISKINSK